jgi:biotin carboxyl carrier protein
MFRAMTTSHKTCRVELAGSQLSARTTEYGVQFADDEQPVPLIDGDRLRSFIGLYSDGVDAPIYVEEGDEPGEFTVYVHGEVVPVRVITARDERLQALRKNTAGAGTSGHLVAAPMPGMLKEMMVKVGQVVAKGETLCILEAMKMENEIKAPARLVVSRLMVPAGTAVEKGAPLLELQPEA